MYADWENQTLLVGIGRRLPKFVCVIWANRLGIASTDESVLLSQVPSACRSLEGVQSSFAQMNAVKEQMEAAQGALRKVDTSKLAEESADGQA